MKTGNRSNSFDSQATGEGITRRAFLAGGGASVAALMLPFLGLVDGKRAYALDYLTASDSEDDEDPTAHIIVLSRSEIGLAVYDVDEEGTTTPVSGAKVVIKSSDSDAQTLEATSDDFGTVVFDIMGMGSMVDYGSMGSRYCFEGSVTVTNGPDYRVCTLKKIRVESGTALKIPCCRIVDASLPYFESLSFNGWDMQYCDCEVIRCPQALGKIPLEGTLRMNGVDSVKVSFYARRTDKKQELVEPAIFSENITLVNGVGSFSRSARYLYYDPDITSLFSDLLPIDRTFEIHFSVNGKDHVFKTKLSVNEPLLPYQTGNSTVVPSGAGVGNIVTLPSSLPAPFGGSNLSIWTPALPIFFWIVPQGVVIFGVGQNISKSAASIPAFGEKTYVNQTNKGVLQQASTLAGVYESKMKEYRKTRAKAADPNNSSIIGHNFSSLFSATINLQAFTSLAIDETNSSGDRLLGKCALVADFNLSVSVTEQFTIWVIPVFITFTMGMDARASMYGAVQSFLKDPLAIGIINSQTGIAVVLTISASLTIGVGVADVASIGIRGSGYISMYTGLLDDSSPKDSPHLVLGAGLSADVVVQALVFKWSGKIWSYDWPRLYDSWGASVNADDSNSSAASAPGSFALGTNPDGSGIYSSNQSLTSASISMDEFMKNASIITAEELLQSSELRATKVETPALDASDSENLQPTALGNGMYVTPLDVSPAAITASNEEQNGVSADTEEYADGYRYEYCGNDPEANCLGAPGVSGIHEQGGVIPTKDMTIARNAFSNPREKVIIYDSIVYLFRLASVEYTINGQSQGRTRLVAQIYNDDTGRWGRPQVLDIPCDIDGVTREDLFDFDFDVCTQTDTNPASLLYQGIYVCVVSSLRENGNSTTFDQAACAPFISVAAFNRNLKRYVSSTWRDKPGAASGKPYAITCPRIATLTMSSGTPSLAAMTYLRHSADQSTEVFGPNATVTCHMALPLKNAVVHPTPIDMPPTTYAMSITPVDAGSVSGGGVGAFSIFTQSNKTQNSVVTSVMSIHTVSVGVDTKLANAVNAEEENAALQENGLEVSSMRNIDQVDTVDDLKPWPGHFGFLSLHEGELFETTYDPSTKDGRFSSKPIGPSTLKLSSFKTSANGNVLFFVENKEGKSAQTYDSATGEPLEGEDENRYRIMGSLYEGGLFSEPFPLGALSHPLDTLEGISGRSTYTLLGSQITSMNPAQADLHFLDIPVVATATVMALTAEEVFATQGEEAGFFVALRNDGNVILTGCRATLYDAATGEAVATTELPFTPNNICASVWNPELAPDASEEAIASARVYPEETVSLLESNGTRSLLANPVESGVLLPGKTSQYRASFMIPNTWHGEKDVRVGVSDFSYEVIVSGAEEGEEALPIQHTAEQDALPSTDVFVHSESEAFDPGLSAPGVQRASETEDFDQNGTGSAESTQSGPNSQTSNTAQTGDGLGLTVAGLLAGAAAAGFAAYSARRSKLENEKMTDGEGGHREEPL